MKARYDVFISYTRRLHGCVARALALALIERGYDVWFDETQLRRKTSHVMQSHEQLMEVMQSGIERSSCLILFEMRLALIPKTEGFDEERAIRAHQVTRSSSGVLHSWTWQAFEFSCAEKAIVVEANALNVEGVIRKLHAKGIFPSRAYVERACYVTERSELPEPILTPLERVSWIEPPAGNYERFLLDNQFEIQKALSFRKPGRHFAIIAGEGGGKTAFIRNIATTLAEVCVTPYLVRLDENTDVDACFGAIRALPESQLIIFDDLGDALEKRIDRDQISAELEFALREHQAVFVLTADQADELIRRDTRTWSFLLFDALKIEEKVCLNPASRQVSSLVLRYWLHYLDSGAIPHRVGCAEMSKRLVEMLELIPIAADLRPPDYSSLEVPFLVEPARSLAVLSRMITLGAVDTVFDQDYVPAVYRTLTALTGLHQYVFAPSGRPERLNEEIAAAAQISIESAEELTRKIFSATLFPDRVPKLAAVAATAEKCEALARALAETLFGNPGARLSLDYSQLEEQIIAVDFYTRTFEWLVRSVNRYPYWVLGFRRLDLAPTRDRGAVNKIIKDGFLKPESKKILFDRCLLVLDSQSVNVLPALEHNFRLTVVS